MLGAAESARFGVEIFDTIEMRHAYGDIFVAPMIDMGHSCVAGTLRVGEGCQVDHVVVWVGHTVGWKLGVRLLPLCCEVIELSIIVKFILGINVSQLLKIDLVTQNGTNTTKALDELIALAGSIGDEFQCRAKVLVLLSKPLQEGALVDDFHLLTSLLVHELFTINFLKLGGVEDPF